MNQLPTLAAVLALAFGFVFTGPATARHGDCSKPNHPGCSGPVPTSVFAAPFMEEGGAQVTFPGGVSSEGLVTSSGHWAIATTDCPAASCLAAGTTFEICLDAVSAPVGKPLHLDDATAVSVDAIVVLVASGQISSTDEGDWQGPTLQVRDDSGADDCSNTLLQESGITIDVP